MWPRRGVSVSIPYQQLLRAVKMPIMQAAGKRRVESVRQHTHIAGSCRKIADAKEPGCIRPALPASVHVQQTVRMLAALSVGVSWNVMPESTLLIKHHDISDSLAFFPCLKSCNFEVFTTRVVA